MKLSYTTEAPIAVSGEGEGKTVEFYPEVNLRGDAANEIAKGCAAGDEFTATVRCRVLATQDRAQRSGVENNAMDGPMVELELLEMDGITKADKAPLGDDSAEEAVDKYRATKGKARAYDEGDD